MGEDESLQIGIGKAGASDSALMGRGGRVVAELAFAGRESESKALATSGEVIKF